VSELKLGILDDYQGVALGLAGWGSLDATIEVFTAQPLSARLEQSFIGRVRSMPDETQRFLLLAAAEPEVRSSNGIHQCLATSFREGTR
jgi:hypothetical protein